MRLFYWLRAKFREWNYKRKYGMTPGEALEEYYGKRVIITEDVVYLEEKEKNE